MDEKITQFFDEAETAFKFLVEKYGYQYLGPSTESLEEWRDAAVFIRYISKSVGIWVSWGLYNEYVGVAFFETIQSWVFPDKEQCSRFWNHLNKAKSINFRTFAYEWDKTGMRGLSNS